MYCGKLFVKHVKIALNAKKIKQLHEGYDITFLQSYLSYRIFSNKSALPIKALFSDSTT